MSLLSRLCRYNGILVAVISEVSIAGALLLQHIFGWEPCPLCILQRMAMLGVFFFALLALAWRKLSGPALGVSTLFAAGGVAATGMHFWVLWGPGSRSCGAGLKIWVANFVDALPGSGWLFKATGDCALATDRLLGLPLPVWSCGVFLVLLAILLAPALKRVFAQSGPGTER